MRERRIQGRSLHSLTAALGNSKEPEGFPVAWEIANAFSAAQSPIALLASRARGDCARGAATLQPSFCSVGTRARRLRPGLSRRLRPTANLRFLPPSKLATRATYTRESGQAMDSHKLLACSTSSQLLEE